MKSKFRKGFTLIELLVVIAIIGILASIVLVTFPGATKKAKDSRIISAISQARTVMTYVYANTGHYDSFKCDYEDLKPLCLEIKNNNPGGINPNIDIRPATDSTTTAIWSALNAGGWYCADSSGIAGFTTTSPTNGVCPTGTSG